MKQFAEKTLKTVFETNDKGEMKQNVRNAFKADLMKAFAEFMAETGVRTLQVDGGVALVFENETEGAVTVVFDGTVKGFTFDAEFENEEFMKAKAEKAEKAEKAKAEKEKKMADAKALKEKKEKAKA